MITKYDLLNDLLNEWLGQTCVEIGTTFTASVIKFETFGEGTSFAIHLDNFVYQSFKHDIEDMGKIFFVDRNPIKYLANKVISEYYLNKVHKFKLLAEQELYSEKEYFDAYTPF